MAFTRDKKQSQNLLRLLKKVSESNDLKIYRIYFYNKDGIVAEIKTMAATDRDIQPGFVAVSFSLSIL